MAPRPPWIRHWLLPRPGKERSIVINSSACLCVFVCLSVREHISGPIFTKFCVQFPRGRGSVLLWRRCDSYVLPVSWMTSRLAVVGRMAKRGGRTVTCMRLSRAALWDRDAVWWGLWMLCFVCLSSTFHCRRPLLLAWWQRSQYVLCLHGYCTNSRQSASCRSCYVCFSHKAYFHQLSRYSGVARNFRQGVRWSVAFLPIP